MRVTLPAAIVVIVAMAVLLASFLTLFINHFEGTTQSALGATHKEQGANGIDGSSLPTNDFAHVRGMNAQLINSHPVAFSRGDGDGIRPVDQPLNHVIQKSFHTRLAGELRPRVS
jgi:hypothetical protein